MASIGYLAVIRSSHAAANALCDIILLLTVDEIKLFVHVGDKERLPKPFATNVY